jgi:hypothetical protein
VTCAILAPAGSHRSRMLSMLYKDERASAPGAVPQFAFLEKMLMERLIAPCAPARCRHAHAHARSYRLQDSQPRSLHASHIRSALGDKFA